MNDSFTIRKASWAEDQASLLRVRTAVFVIEQGVPESIEVDEYDAVSTHFLALAGDAHPIGTARLLPVGKIGRVAVLQDYRRKGIGQALMEAAISSWQNGPDRETPLRLHAQVSSLPFYESLGFTAYGPEFEEAGIPHREMSLPLPKSDAKT